MSPTLHQFAPASPGYGLAMVGGLIVSLALWLRLNRRDTRMVGVYLGGLIGAIVGAKLGYALAEWPWLMGDPRWLGRLLVGKTVLGALLGGYGGVELGKAVQGVREATGDRFALVVPVGVAVGRVGCLVHGCCAGVAIVGGGVVEHFPAAAVELGFNLAAAAALAVMYARGGARGQLFHVYLVAYGLFRFAVEPWRDTPKFGGSWLGPYALLALAVAALGAARFVARARRGVAGASR